MLSKLFVTNSKVCTLVTNTLHSNYLYSRNSNLVYSTDTYLIVLFFAYLLSYYY